MMRLRCYLFGKLVSEERDRVLDENEVSFITRHRCECEDCREREMTTVYSLEALQRATVPEKKSERTESLTTRKILESLERSRRLRASNGSI